MTDYTIRPLGSDTWDDFAHLIERQGTGSMGAPACWCLWFHPGHGAGDPGESARLRKERFVMDGRAHAALVFDGDLDVGTEEEVAALGDGAEAQRPPAGWQCRCAAHRTAPSTCRWEMNCSDEWSMAMVARWTASARWTPQTHAPWPAAR